MTPEEINNKRLVSHLETALTNLKDQNLVRGFTILSDGSFLVKPNYIVEKIPLTLELITAYQEQGNLTCEMVDWLKAEINFDDPQKKEALALLAKAFREGSSMWKQSHFGLRDYLAFHGITV